MVNKLKDTVVLGSVFKTWKLYTTSVLNGGIVANFYFPPKQKDDADIAEILECLKI